MFAQKKIRRKIASWLLVTDSESEDIDSEVREDPGPMDATLTLRNLLGGMCPIYNLDNTPKTHIAEKGYEKAPDCFRTPGGICRVKTH